MRYLSMTLLMLLLAGCSTTMPRSTDSRRIDSEGAVAGAVVGGLIGSILSERRGAVMGAAIGAMAFRPPTRKYVGIPSRKLYDFALINLTNNKFEIIRSDSDVGIVHAKLEKGIVKQFLFWRWEQEYYVIYEIRSGLDEKDKVRFYYTFWVEEKPPLSSDYVRVESDKDAKMIDVSLLSSIDEYVKNNGGRY